MIQNRMYTKSLFLVLFSLLYVNIVDVVGICSSFCRQKTTFSACIILTIEFCIDALMLCTSIPKKPTATSKEMQINIYIYIKQLIYIFSRQRFSNFSCYIHNKSLYPCFPLSPTHTQVYSQTQNILTCDSLSQLQICCECFVWLMCVEKAQIFYTCALLIREFYASTSNQYILFIETYEMEKFSRTFVINS